MTISDKPVYLVFRGCGEPYSAPSLVGAYAYLEDAQSEMQRGIRESIFEGETWKIVEFRGTVETEIDRESVPYMEEWGD